MIDQLITFCLIFYFFNTVLSFWNWTLEHKLRDLHIQVDQKKRKRF